MSGMKRTASDLAASKMGDLLLKGYRMLDASCQSCGTVLMRSRSGDDVCVTCADGAGDKATVGGYTAPVYKNDSNALEDTERMDTVSVVPEVRQDGKSTSSGIEQVINDLVMEMQGTTRILKATPMSLMDFSGSGGIKTKKEMIEYIKLLADTISELKKL